MSVGGCQDDRENRGASPTGVTVASLFQSGPAGGLEQIDAYLEALLKEDHLTTLNGRALESGRAKDTEA